MRRNRWIATLALSSVLAVTAACTSSGGSGGKTPTGAAPSTNSALQGDPIVLGTICSCSGPQAAALGLVKDSANAWAAWTNASGGVNGHPVKLIVEDDGSNPATALQAVKKLVEQDHVIAIVGETSLVDANWASYIQSKGVPVVGGLSVEAPFLSNPDFFATGASVPVMIVGQFAAMQQQNLKSFGVLYCAESPVCAQLDGLAKLAAGVTGGTISTHSGKVAATSPNYNAQCLAMKNGKVDGLQIAAASTVVTRVADQCATLGYKPIQINQTTTFAQDWLKNPNLDGALLISSNANYLDDSVPGVKDFLDALAKYQPNVPASDQFGYDNIYPWIGGQLFAAAAKAGNLTSTSKPADVTAALYQLEGETLNGLTAPLTFTKGQPNFVNCYYVTQVKSGKLTSLNDGKESCLSNEQTTALANALKQAGS